MARTQILHVAVDKVTEKMLRQEAKKNSVTLSVILRWAINSYLADTAVEPSDKSKGQAA